MKINHLHHIGMSVPDLEVARQFYCGVLGFEEANMAHFGPMPAVDAIMGLKGAEGNVVFLRHGSFAIEMFEFATPKPSPLKGDAPVCEYGISHFCLDVADVDALYKHCVEKGMTFHCEPISTHGVRTVYGRDPFGNVIELQQIENNDVADENWTFNVEV